MTMEHLGSLPTNATCADDYACASAVPSRRASKRQPRSFETPEDILRRDPSGHYENMERETKAAYRAQIRQLSLWSDVDRAAVADAAIDLALEASDSGAAERHVGFYLLGAGRKALERKLGARVPLRWRTVRALQRYARPIHFGMLACGALGMIAACLFFAARTGVVAETSVASAAFLVALGLLAFAPISEGLLREASDALLPRGILPKMRTLPANVKALVVVPCLLSSTQRVAQLCAKLETLFSQCDSERFIFALLSDFPDSAEPETEDERNILRQAFEQIDRCNASNGRSADSPAFVLLHRDREWCAADSCWQGRERKRGKLAALFQFMNGLAPFPFFAKEGSDALLRSVPYVISLDCDTELTANAAQRMLCTALHPLNQAHVSVRDGRRHIRGFGILQPCICSTRIAEHASVYERWQFTDLGTENKLQGQHDMSQEWFAESGFFGKGLYDVKAFCDAKIHELPERLILSHDIVEGALMRPAALVDIGLAEQNPRTYLAGISRRHRWMRGDWQNLLWLISDASKSGSFRTSTEPQRYIAAAYAIVGNVVRNNCALLNAALILLGCIIFPHSPAWAIGVVTAMALPVVVSTLKALVQAAADCGTPRRLIPAAGALLGAATRRFVFGLSTLYFDAAMTLDAQVRATWRVCVSGRLILQWTESAVVAHEGRLTYWRSMGPYLALSLCVLGLDVGLGMDLGVACVLALLWLASPALAWRTGLAHTNPESEVSAPEAAAAQPYSDRA